MSSKWIVAAALAAALVLPVALSAHEGHPHKVMGTVTSIAPPHIMVKTADGKTAMVMWDAKTKFTRGKAKVAVEDVKVGDRVVAEGPEQNSMVMATSVQLGTAAAAAPAKTAAKK
jgi:hypothetical protein